jgi:hypothetical protein
MGKEERGMIEYKDWIVRFYASHKDIPKGHSDCETLKELVRCGDCIKKDLCCLYRDTKDENGFCKWAERKEE